MIEPEVRLPRIGDTSRGLDELTSGDFPHVSVHRRLAGVQALMDSGFPAVISVQPFTLASCTEGGEDHGRRLDFCLKIFGEDREPRIDSPFSILIVFSSLREGGRMP